MVGLRVAGDRVVRLAVVHDVDDVEALRVVKAATDVGDAVTLLGTDGDVTIDAQDIAKTAGTISYSVLCGIHARVKRVYI